jgi:hypothetical protein
MKEKTMSANTEKCADKDKSVCDYNEFRRLRYFHGMLLDDKDFQAEQQYHAGKRRFLNRMLHGSGVVCGLELRGEKGKRWIEVTSGLALDCSGNEIWVQKNLRIDLASLLPPKTDGKGKGECQPEDEDDGLLTYYIGIRYEEKPTNPVSVYLPSGGCEERSCENSRWKEGYCVEIVECCYAIEKPGLLEALCQCESGGSGYSGDYQDLCGECGEDPNKTGNPLAYGKQDPNQTKEWCQCMVVEEFCERSVPCSECCSCDQPCHVILGQIKIDPENCVLETLCMNECRRYVLTGRLVQQVLLRIVSGSEDRLEIKVGSDTFKLGENKKFAEYIYNPIKALCWWLSYKLKGADFQWLDCDRKRPQDTLDHDVLLAEVRKVAAKQEADYKILTDRLNELQTLGDIASQITTEKQKQPKK